MSHKTQITKFADSQCKLVWWFFLMLNEGFSVKIIDGQSMKIKSWRTYLRNIPESLRWPPGWWRMPFLRSNKIFRQAFDEVLLHPVSLTPLFAYQTKENKLEWKINRKCKLKEVQEEEIIKKLQLRDNQNQVTTTGWVSPPMRLSRNRLLQPASKTRTRNSTKTMSDLS